jgi:hypothetical protein
MGEHKMVENTKGKSPFYPGQPVPVELFVGRNEQIERILQRGVGQVAAGKPVAMFVQGEYGIGKSSVASLVQRIAESSYNLHAIYASLAGCKSLSDIAAAILEGTIKSGAFEPTRSEKIRGWLAKYIGTQHLYGFTLNLEALKKDAPNFTTPFSLLSFLQQVKQELAETGVRGIFLVLDEINGVASDPQFSALIKGIVDSNAIAKEPLPLLLMLCGVEERRREMIAAHSPIDRIFDVVEIGIMSEPEMREFFTQAFQSVQMAVDDAAMSALTFHSAGLPKIMHMIGDAAYWLDRDSHIDEAEAIDAVLAAAEDIGKKYVDAQVYKALRSSDYRSILKKIAKTGIAMSFQKSEVEKGLTSAEKSKLNNFLQRMKRLHVLRSGDVRGEYIFNIRMVRVYIWLQSQRMS